MASTAENRTELPAVLEEGVRGEVGEETPLVDTEETAASHSFLAGHRYFRRGWRRPGSFSRRVRPCGIALLGMLTLILLGVVLAGVIENDRGKLVSRPKTVLVTAEHGAVAAENAYCSAVGTTMLREGGSAVDAAIASALCVGTVNSFSSGIGGGGYMLIRDTNGTSEVIDYRETAPGAASRDMYEGDVPSGIVGPLSIAVPGELRGFEMAHGKYGRLPWRRLFEPAIALARDGFTTTPLLAQRLRTPMVGEAILKDEAMSGVFAPNGTLLRAGEMCYRPRYAETLELVSRHGADAFYSGTAAAWMVEDMRLRGGIIEMSDLTHYRAISRESISTYYHGRRIITGGPPTSGPVLLSIMSILERYGIGRPNGLFPSWGDGTVDRALDAHRLVEAFKWAFASRGDLGDPGYVRGMEGVVERFLSKEEADRIRRAISDERTFPSEHYNATSLGPENHGTMHISVVDGADQAVSLMSTVNLYFGSWVMSPRTGVIFNDEMADFSTPNTTNVFGVPPSPQNFIVGGKRPMSSATPVIVERDGRFEVAMGSSGGTRIITAVVQCLVNALDLGMALDEAIETPRLHHQLYPPELLVEREYSPATVRALERKGHTIVWAPAEVSQSAVQAVRRLPDGSVEASSDGRKHGIASGF